MNEHLESLFKRVVAVGPEHGMVPCTIEEYEAAIAHYHDNGMFPLIDRATAEAGYVNVVLFGRPCNPSLGGETGIDPG